MSDSNPEPNLGSSGSGPRKRENPWLNFGFNIIIPILLLTKGSDWFGFSATTNLVVSLAFPVSYGLYDFVAREKFNFVSVLGFVSILLTGGIGLLKLPPGWIAVKEAAIPLALGIAVVLSARTRYPLVRVFLLNPEVVETEKIQRELESRGNVEAFNRLLQTSTWWVAASLLLSAVLNFVLAKIVVTSPSGTEAFNAELGRMQGLSYVVIFIPTMAVLMFAMIKLFKGIKELTGLELEQFLAGAQPPPPAGANPPDSKPGK